jgi:hypothetical protein
MAAALLLQLFGLCRFLRDINGGRKQRRAHHLEERED